MSEFPTTQVDGRPGPVEADTEGEPLMRLVARYWLLFKKFYWILIATCLLGVVGAHFYTERLPRIYAANASIIFRDTPQNVFGGVERVDLVDPGGQWHFEKFWNTQKEVMRSRWFAESVVEREGLIDVEGFVPNPAGKDRDALKKIAASRVLGMSSVSLKPNSKVAVVTTETTDPDHAKIVADGIARTYVAYTREYQSGGVNNIIEWFNTYVSEKREELTAAQTELHKFKRDNNILSISYEERQNLTAANMEAVNSQLNGVRDKLDGAEALLQQIENMDRSGSDMRALVRVTESASIGSAIEALHGLNRQLAKVRTRYGEQHEKVREITRQKEVVEATLDEEIRRLREGTEAKVATLRREEARKVQRLAELKEEAFDLNELGLDYNQMRDRANTLSSLYDTVLKRSEELDISWMYESKSIDVLETASRPGAPVRPNVPLNLAIGLVVGLLLGGGMIVLIDNLDNTVRGEQDVERYTSKPILGHLPQVDQALIKEFGSIDTMTDIAPKSSFAEGIKTLRTNLMFMSPDEPPRLMLVTSPGPGEGKTLISINMAIAMAQSGLRTLIVDSDMRRPRIHKALGLDNDVGLSSVILGDAEIDDVVQSTDTENLFAMTCSQIPPNPLELLHTEKFQGIVDELGSRYDRVIFDSPPLAAVSDGLVLSQSVDAVLLILKFGQTRKELLKRSIEQLDALGAPLMGCVLNDISSAVGSAYAYSYYYYRYRYEDEDNPTTPTRLAS